MKKYLLLLALLPVFLTACNKEDADDMMWDDPFFGPWLITEASGDFAESNEGTTYTFTDSGEVTVEKGAIFNEGTYTRNDSMILMVLSGIDVNYFYILEDGRMEWEHPDGVQSFIMERP